MGNKYHGILVTPIELSCWLSAWASKHNLHIALTLDQRRLVTKAVWNDNAESIAELSIYREMWISTKPIVTSGTTPIEVMYLNKDCLTIQLPRFDGKQLRETLIGWVTTDPATVVVWQLVLSHVKRFTRAYTWDLSFFDREGATEVKRRASPEAMALYLNGGTLTDYFGNKLTRRRGQSG